MEDEDKQYGHLLGDIKTRIQQAQTKAVLSVNSEMILLYWDIGQIIHQRQKKEGWGAGVIPRLSLDLKNELPEVRGFSERNIKLMVQYFNEYPEMFLIRQRAVAQIDNIIEQRKDETKPSQNEPLSRAMEFSLLLGWAHNIILIQKVKDVSTRVWYMQQCIKSGWSRDTLRSMIDSKTHERQGKTVGNFELRLPEPQSEMVRQTLKDPYIFDFLTISEPFRERELEINLIQHLEKFLLELGHGFAYVGRQYHLDVSEKDFYIDLLFYHLKLRCFIVVDLKKGEFKPEYGGKMNFYCSAIDDNLKHEDDQPTIGLILCQTKDRLIAEYSLRDMNKPIGVSGYELTQALPDRFKSSLPSIEEIEKELGGKVKEDKFVDGRKGRKEDEIRNSDTR